MDQVYVKLAQKVADETGGDQEKAEVYLYALRVWGSTVVTMSLMFVLSWLLGIFALVFSSSTSAAILRLSSGGSHNQRALVCTSVSVIVHLCLAYLTLTLNWLNWQWITAIILSVFLFTLYSIYTRAPADVPAKPITDPQERAAFRRNSYVRLFVITLVHVGLLWTGYPSMALAGSLGLLWQATTLHPISASMMHIIDRITDPLFSK